MSLSAIPKRIAVDVQNDGRRYFTDHRPQQVTFTGWYGWTRTAILESRAGSPGPGLTVYKVIQRPLDAALPDTVRGQPEDPSRRQADHRLEKILMEQFRVRSHSKWCGDFARAVCTNQGRL